MPSLAKVQLTDYPIFDISPTKRLRYQEGSFKKPGGFFHNSSSITKKNILNNRSFAHCPQSLRKSLLQDSYHHSHKSPEKDDKNHRDPSYEQKKYIDKFITGLAQDINTPCEPISGQGKLKVLKKIIENYDIKTLQKNQYSKLIKTFGLQIESAKPCEKNNDVKQKQRAATTRYSQRSFTIRSKQQDRSSRLKNRIDSNSKGQVALFECSQQLPVVEREEEAQSPKKKVQTNSQKLRISFQFKKNKIRPETKEIIKKPFKYKSKQDIIVEKVNKYREFLCCLNYSNYLYRNLTIVEYQKPLRYYIGKGNNSNMIRSLMKRRYWFEETHLHKNANFVWTQIKVQDIYCSQPDNQFYHALQSSRKQKQQRVAIKQEKKFIRNFNSLNRKTSINQQNLSKILIPQELSALLKIHLDASMRSTVPMFIERINNVQRRLNHKNMREEEIVHNHLPSNGIIGNKKGLFYCLREYYKLKDKNIWEILPLTFHIRKGIADPEYKQFLGYYQQRKKQKLKNVWIMKPGQFSNRGNGISCSNKLEQIKKKVLKCQKIKKGNQLSEKTVILQLYITNPLLYNNRKFDIRVFMLVTSHNGKIKGYWYQEGYIRTSSYTFDLNQIADIDIHLTNDAVQKQTDSYGKYEPGNKLSFNELQRYLDSLPANGRNLDINNSLVPRMKEIAGQILQGSFLFLDENRKQNNFQIFGLDFMVDYYFKPWLIEVNTNPCLELNCPLMERIIPNMVQNSLRIAVDTIFPPPETVPNHFKYTIPENAAYYNKFQLIFDENRDGPAVKSLFRQNPNSEQVVSELRNIEEQKQVFAEEGILCQFDI